MELIVILAVLAGLIGMLIWNKLDPALVFVVALLIYMFAGFLPAKEMLNAFANETLIALILLLIVSGVVEKSYFLPWISRKIFKKSSQRQSMFRLASFSVLLSSHLNNTAVVASMMGVVKTNRHFSPSKFLIPLSYASIMGGVLTLVGTSTNLIVNSFAVKAGLPPIQYYDFIYIGLPLAVFGILFLVFIASRILPDNGKGGTPSENGNYFLECVVTDRSPLIGKSVKANGLRQLSNLFVAELIRDGRLISPVMPDEVLEAGDTLVFTGDLAQIQELRKFEGLTILDRENDILRSNLQEVVIRHNAPVLGQKIKDAQFRTRFDAAVVAVRRGDEKLSGKIGEIEMEAGDNLVLAVGKEFEKHENLRRNFIFISPVETIETLDRKESIIAGGLFLAGILASATELISLLQAMILLIFAYWGLGYLKLKQLRNNLNLGLFLMIGASLGISDVLAKYGVADLLGKGIIDLVGGAASPMMALIGVYIATVLVTEVVTNNAAAALMFPIALSTATQLGVSPTPFIMGIAYAASASFLTPIGYQTNTMVYSLGKYSFGDYFKTGLGLTIVYSIVVVSLLPVFFPF